MFVEYLLKIDLLSLLNTFITNILDVAFDIYFSYCIYSCWKIGQGETVLATLPSSVHNFGTHQTDDVYVANEYKEVVAYPAPKVLPECEMIIAVNFTENNEENI